MADDDFAPVKPADDFSPVAKAAPSAPQPAEGPMADVVFSRGRLGKIVDAFGAGWTNNYGPDPVGLSKESEKWFAEKGVLYDKVKGGSPSVMMAMGEAFIRPAAGAIDLAMRTANAAAHAVGDAAIEAGVPRDFVAMAGYHMLKPDRIGRVEFRPSLPRDTVPTAPDYVPAERIAATVEKIDQSELTAPQLRVARKLDDGTIVKGEPGQIHVDLVKPDESLSNKVEAQMGFTSPDGTFLNRQEALDYAKANEPERAAWSTQPGQEAKGLEGYSYYTAEKPLITASKAPPKEREFVETRGGGRQFHGTPREMFDADPYHYGSMNYYGNGLYTTDAMDVAHGYTKRKGREGEGSVHEIVPNREVKTFNMEEPVPTWLTKDMDGELGNYVKAIEEGEFDTKPKNVRELYDQIREYSRGEGYSADTVQEMFDMLRSKMEEQGYEAMSHKGGLRTKTNEHNVTIHFDPTDYKVAPIDRDAFVKPQVTDLDAAADLGVIGEPKPSPFEQPKTMAAERTDPAGTDLVRRSDEVGNPASDKAGNIRLDLIETSKDAENVIRTAAEANGGYMEARRGEISLAHQQELSQVLGVPVEQLDMKGIGRRLQNDADLRTSIQAMVQSSEQVVTLARDAHLSGDPKDLIKFQEAWMRHDVLQETVAGLTAEWGRTGNVFQEFRERVKDTKALGEFLKEKRGRSVEDLRDMAGKLASLEPGQVPQFLADSRKQGFWDKMHFYWVNAILSGQFTQASYLAADFAFGLVDNLAIRPVAGAVGAVRELAGSTAPRAYLGEGFAGLYGYLAGVPAGLRASWETAKTGEHPLLPREVSMGKNPVTEQHRNPIGGTVGAIIGAPSRELSMIHALQSNMAYRSQIEAMSYREAVKAGHTPGTAAFWSEYRGKAQFPTEAMMDEAVAYSQRMTWTEPLVGAQKAIRDLVRNPNVPGVRYIVPFTQVPMNALNAIVEGTPMTFLNDKQRANMTGKNGKLAQDTQIARLAVGSTIMGIAASWALNEDITGNGPVNQEDRAVWLLTHAPNSVKIGDRWVNVEKLGPLGGLMVMAADVVEAGKSGMVDKEYDQMVGHLAVAASNMLLNNTGMKGLADLSEAIRSKDVAKSLAKWGQNFAASFSPFSSATGQVAGLIDPNMREVQGLLDAFKNKIPKLREDLFPARDWSGVVRANSRSEWGALFKAETVNKDPVDLELETLNFKPSKMSQYVGDVKLTPTQYDQLQTIAGVATRTALNSLVQQDGWYALPAFAREDAIRNTITGARKYATSIVQMQSVGTADDIVRQAVQAKVDRLHK